MLILTKLNYVLATRSSSMEDKAHREPSKLPYQLLKQITNDFHEEQLLGSGTFGKVYKV